jgi:hypothetical protein
MGACFRKMDQLDKKEIEGKESVQPLPSWEMLGQLELEKASK